MVAEWDVFLVLLRYDTDDENMYWTNYIYSFLILSQINQKELSTFGGLFSFSL